MENKKKLQKLKIQQENDRIKNLANFSDDETDKKRKNKKSYPEK